MPRDAGEVLRNAMSEMGVPPSVDKRVRSYRTSLSAMMGEDAPRQLIDLDNYLLTHLETLSDIEPDRIGDRLNEALRDWSEANREDLYGLSPEELRESLIKLEDLSFRDGVRVALEDPQVISSMFVLLKSGNIDYRRGAIFTLEEAVKRDPRCIDMHLFEEVVTGPFSKEERVMLIENATEFGRMIGRMILSDKAREHGESLVRTLVGSGEDTQVRVALKTFTHLSKVDAERVEVPLVEAGLDSENDFNRETAARVVQNLAKHVPDRVPEQLIEKMTDDRTWAVRQVAANALLNLWRHDAARAEAIVNRFRASGDPNREKVVEKAEGLIRKAVEKKAKKDAPKAGKPQMQTPQ